MFSFCVGHLGLSEDAACNRIYVMRAMRRFPLVLECVRTGQVHLSGLRILEPHLTEENHREVLAKAAGQTKRAIEELVATLAPKPPVPDSIRQLPRRSLPTPPSPAPLASSSSLPPAEAPAVLAPVHPVHRPTVKPLAPDSFRFQFTADGALRDKVELAQDLLRHRVPNGSLASIVDLALDLLIGKVKKERFGDGRKPRAKPPEQPQSSQVEQPRSEQSEQLQAPFAEQLRTPPAQQPQPKHSEPPRKSAEQPRTTRHIPADVSRSVVERDGYRCAYVDKLSGKRCEETGWLEQEHLDGFARTHQHSTERVSIHCRTHNQYAADLMYGRDFMARKRGVAKIVRPGAGNLSLL